MVEVDILAHSIPSSISISLELRIGARVFQSLHLLPADEAEGGEKGVNGFVR